MKNQKGFSPIEGLLILVILGLLGFVGWFVWNTNSATNKSLTNADSVSNSPLPKIKSPIQDGYLLINEWGVKLKPSDDAIDAYYIFQQYDGLPKNQSLDLNSKEFDNLKDFEGKSCKGESIATIDRYKKNDPALNTDKVPGAAVGKRIAVSDYVYTFSVGKQYASPCLYDLSKGENAPVLTANKKLHDEKVAAFTKMYDTIAVQ